ncbi:MAG: hypothetical protein AAGF26_10820, partial [Cyanobacteria bacterium P01_G01_bin.49]
QHEKMMDRESLIDLLDSAFVFGREPSANSIFWDLRSYNNKDKSYDIYWANSDCFSGEIYKLGRDFYEFITEFCLGTKSFEILPKEKWPLQESLQKTFTRVQPNWDLLDLSYEPLTIKINESNNVSQEILLQFQEMLVQSQEKSLIDSNTFQQVLLQFQETLSNTSQETLPINNNTSQEMSPNISSEKLKGEALLKMAKELANIPRTQMAIQCGYYTSVTTEEGQTSRQADLEAFYNAVLEAKGVK